MTKRLLVALLITVLFGGKAFADCVPSPDTPASVIEYFKSFNKPLPEQFCIKGNAPQASEEPSQEPPQVYDEVPEASPLDEPRGHYAQLSPVPEAHPPPPYGEWPRHFEFRSRHFRFEWFY
jgi:hypothetical protein